MENDSSNIIEEVIVGLVRSQHSMPVDEYIFDDGDIVGDLEYNEKHIKDFIKFS